MTKVCQSLPQIENWQKQQKKVDFMHEYSRIFEKKLKLLISSITLWSQNNDTLSHKKLEKNPGIQAIDISSQF